MQADSVMRRSIDRMAERIAGIVDGKMHSVWLYGSVVMDDFRPGWSDIDLLALTEGQITDAQALELAALRQTMGEAEPGNPYFRLFEGIVARAEEYFSGTYSRLVYWGTTGQRITDHYQPDAFSRYELARYGQSVLGRKDRRVFSAPSGDELAAAVRSHYESIRRYAVQTDERLYSCGWLLDIARCVHTLRHGGVIAKTQAGAWALAESVFPDAEPLRKTLLIRQDPLAYRDRDDVKRWLKGLGPTVQRYADILERDLSRYEASRGL